MLTVMVAFELPMFGVCSLSTIYPSSGRLMRVFAGNRAVIDMSQDDQVVEGRSGRADMEVAVVVDGGGADGGNLLRGDQATEQADRGGIGLGLRLLGRAGDLSVDRPTGDQRQQRNSGGSGRALSGCCEVPQ